MRCFEDGPTLESLLRERDAPPRQYPLVSRIDAPHAADTPELIAERRRLLCEALQKR